MKMGRILTYITILAGIFVAYLYSKPIYNYIHNYSLDYTKEVYLCGDNIVLDYLAPSEDKSVSAVSEYATIGTITYVDKDNNFGAIGHGIDNYKESGNIYIVPVDSVIKSNKKYLGEKNVIVNRWTSNGEITKIGSVGVFGKFDGDLSNNKTVLVGMPSEIEISDALIYTNIDGNEVKAYKIQIEKVFYMRKTHNIYIRIVDQELLDKTGGVIQGMSGSPIVQNGKLIGSLSHVDDNNPEYGYGLFITYMM